MTTVIFMFSIFVVFRDGARAQRVVIEAVFVHCFELGVTELARFLFSLTSVT